MSEVLTTSDRIKNKSNPIFAIIGYQDENMNFSDLKYMEIENNEFKAEIPFTEECLQNLKQAVNTSDDVSADKILSFKSLIPNNVIFFKGKDIVWTINPSKKYLYFKNNFVMKDNYYYLPKLVFAYLNQTLSIFAIKRKNNISENTRLYNAPFLNVYTNGSICMGNTNTNIDNFSFVENVIQYLENAFFKSVFTHTNHNNIIKGNIIEYFNKENTFFDDKILLESEIKTINKLLKNTI